MTDTDGQLLYRDADLKRWLASTTSQMYWDATNERFGIGQSSPLAKLEVLDDTDPQIRLTHTDNVDYAELQVDSDGYFKISTSGNKVYLSDYTSNGFVKTISGNGELTIDTISYYPSANIDDGSTDGEMIYWNSTKWTIISNMVWDETNDRLGINISSPNRKLEVLDDTNPQLRLTHTDGVDYCDLSVDSNGHMYLEPSGGRSFIMGELVVSDTTPSLYAISLMMAYVDNSTAYSESLSGADTYEPLDTDPLSLFNANTSAEMVGLFFRVDSSASAAGKVALIKTADYSSDFSFMLRTASDNMQEVFRISKDKKVKVSYDASNYAELQVNSSGLLNITPSGGNMGVNISSPNRKLEVLDGTNPQLRLTHTDGVDYCDLQVDDDGYLTINPSGEGVIIDYGLAVGKTPAASWGPDDTSLIVTTDQSTTYGIYLDGRQFTTDSALTSPFRYGFVIEHRITDDGFDGDIDDDYALLIRHGSGSGDGQITNSYGLYIYSHVFSAGNPQSTYGIYQEEVTLSAKNYFESNTGFGTTSPDYQVDIDGGLGLRALSSDPADPDDGGSVMWLSDGTDSGDDGDLMVKITNGSVTKTITLVDWSTS
jgi:hypothetical protein